MDPYIGVDDVQRGFKPTIPKDDAEYVGELIREAQLELSSRIGSLAGYVRDDAERRERLEVVLSRMVRRLLLNPDGFVSETDGDYSYTRASGLVGTGAVRVLTDDLRLLGLKRRSPFKKAIRVGLPADSPRNMTTSEGAQ